MNGSDLSANQTGGHNHTMTGDVERKSTSYYLAVYCLMGVGQGKGTALAEFLCVCPLCSGVCGFWNRLEITVPVGWALNTNN